MTDQKINSYKQIIEIFLDKEGMNLSNLNTEEKGFRMGVIAFGSWLHEMAEKRE